MKISEMITDKYKLRIPPTVYYDLLADVKECEEEQEPRKGHWKHGKCDVCGASRPPLFDNFCPNCGSRNEVEE